MAGNATYRNPPLYGHPPVSPLYQGDCTGTADPNPYFPRSTERWWPQPPFWYQGDPCPPHSTWPVGDPDDYHYQTLPQPLSGKTLLEEMEVERPERYLPGEIHNCQYPKRPIQDLSKSTNCQKIWTPKDPRFHCPFQPTPDMLNRPLLLDGVLARKAETMNSFAIPQKIRVEESCEGVEDAETKQIKKPNYYELLKYADTRGPDYVCAPDTTVRFEDSCKLPETTVRVPESVKKKFWRPSGFADENPKLSQEINKECCDCGCE